MPEKKLKGQCSDEPTLKNYAGFVATIGLMTFLFIAQETFTLVGKAGGEISDLRTRLGDFQLPE